jgi:alpha-N-arabinofuranosidase
MTSDQAAWKQTIYYPFAYTSRYGRGIVLQTVIESPVYSIGELDEAQILDAVCVMNDDESLTLFAVNKDLNEDLTLTCGLPSENYTVLEHITLNHADLKAANTEADPDALTPWATDSSSVKNGVLTTVLGRHSWNMIRLGKNGSAE